MLYTEEDVMKSIEENGLTGDVSEWDLELIKQNPDAGMKIVQSKVDWYAATTDDARALANAEANRVREEYGSYNGGDDGMQHILMNEPTATGATTSNYNSQLGGDIYSTLDEMKNYGDFNYDTSAPAYDNRWDGQTISMVNDILNRADFSYDHNEDPMFSAYKKQYLREGDRATANVLGQAAAASGGIPSSYAVGAASHAVGTSRMIKMGEVQAAMSSLAIVVTGILTVIVVPVFAEFL